jgi:hypothetical protein
LTKKVVGPPRREKKQVDYKCLKSRLGVLYGVEKTRKKGFVEMRVQNPISLRMKLFFPIFPRRTA